MADVRKMQPQAGMDARLSRLTDFDECVWWQYVRAANDLGVMPALASVLQAGHLRLAKLPPRRVQAALERIIDAGLLQVFEHDGVRYVWSLKWQDAQDITYPRKSAWPVPVDVTLASPATRELIETFLKKFRKDFQNSENVSSVPKKSFTRARAHAPNPHPNPKPHSEEGGVGETDAPLPAGAVNPHAKATNLVNGAEERRHGSHAWCHRERGLCVPYGLHDEFAARSLKTSDELKAWYARVVEQFAGQPIGDDVFAFWRNSFAAWIGTVTRAPSQRPPTAVEGNLRGLDEDMAVLTARGLPHGS